MPDTRRDDGGAAVPPVTERRHLPAATQSGVEPRFIEVWRAFLDELATDAHKAHAAAIAYRELDAGARDSWITVLEHDLAEVEAPRIAVYAPLLAVESDVGRRKRIVDAMGEVDAAVVPRVAPRALAGRAPRGERVGVLIAPLYLDFVQVLACGFHAANGFEWVRHDPIVEGRAAPNAGDRISGAELESVALPEIVDELALAVVAHVRAGRAVPDALRLFADLFGPVRLGGE
jgi:hypothetical protein